MTPKDAGYWWDEMPIGRPEESGQNPWDTGEVASNITARREHSIPETSQLMEAVVERENMGAAYHRVVKNKGSAGEDGMSVEELLPYLREHWPRIKEELLTRRYTPQAVLRVEIPKPAGKGMRLLGIRWWTE